MKLTAYFFGGPGDPMDKAARALFEGYGGREVGAGTMLVGPGKGERDVQYDIPEGNADNCRAALKKAGFRLNPTLV